MLACENALPCTVLELESRETCPSPSTIIPFTRFTAYKIKGQLMKCLYSSHIAAGIE